MTSRAGETGWAAREIAHTADVGFEVEAPSWPMLLERAALALAAEIADLARVTPREAVVLAVEAGDREELLHDWLQAVLVRVQAGFLPCEVEVALAPGGLRGTLRGEPLDPARHRVHGEVKGVTWHGLTVRETPAGVAARVILDV